MNDRRPSSHRSRMAGTGRAETAETEHPDAARSAPEKRNELDIEARKREKSQGPSRHRDTRNDPDSLEEKGS